MRTSPKMGLRIWNLLLDPYDHEQLADNWAKVDAHDHSEGRGVLIPTEGIALQAITEELLDEELTKRIFSATEPYSGSWTELKGSKPVTASGRTLVSTIVQVAAAEEIELEIVVGGDQVSLLNATTTTSKEIFPLTFYVPDGGAWEWHLYVGTTGNVKFEYKTVEL